MITLNTRLPTGKLKRLKAALGDAQKKLPREIATAVNATSRKVITAAARALKKELTVPVGILKKTIKTKKKASASSPYAVINMWGGHPIPLKYFRATQTKAGVTFKVNPKYKAKSIIRDAFIARQYNGNVYRRKAKARGPLEKLLGPSPGEAFERANVAKIADSIVKVELPKQLERRIRLLMLRASGNVPQRKGSK